VEAVTTGDVYRALWRYRFAISALTVAAVTLAWFLASRQQPIYEASTLVRIQQQITDPSQSLGALATGQKLAETYADIVETSTIASTIVNRSNGHLKLREVAGSIHGSPVAELDLLWIHARNPSPLIALRTANAAPGALRRFIEKTGTLREHVITAQRAELPTAPVAPQVRRTVILVFLTALLLNCGLALLLHALRDPVGDADQLHQVTSLPLLATIPKLALDPAPRARTPVIPPQIAERVAAR
jgi:capsular polysaccharide biosynthesis protein